LQKFERLRRRFRFPASTTFLLLQSQTTRAIERRLGDLRFDDAAFIVPAKSRASRMLLAKGYDVSHEEFDSGHDYAWWRDPLASGLVALIGRSTK